MADTDLTTTAKVKAYLGLPGSTYDTILGTLIAAATTAIESYCRRRFKSRTHTEYHDGADLGVKRTRIVLEHRPVVSVTSVHDDIDQPPTWPASDLVDSDDYVTRDDEGIIELYPDLTFRDGKRNVRVIYTAGYTAIPEDVGQAANMLVAAWFHRGRNGADGLASESIGTYQYQAAQGGLSEPVKALLAPYREVAV